MIDFRTIIPIGKSADTINHTQQQMLLGSCFAENIGTVLTSKKFRTDINPFGILYNPLSIAEALYRMLDGRPFTADELFLHKGVWHSYDHHSRFSHVDRDVCLQQINTRLKAAATRVKHTDWLILTWGTAFVYYLRESGKVVANCHKQPESVFDRNRLSPDEIVTIWNDLIGRIREVNPAVKIIFTVSPIRHFKDGAHQNQLSKSTLLLAIEKLCIQFAGTHYFPSYEIMMDELRDYRFYASDMLHPSELAVEYIWQRFSECYFDTGTCSLIDEWEKLEKSICHRPFAPQSIVYKDFVMQNLFKLKKMSEKYPYFDVRKEVESLEKLLINLH